MVKAIAPVSERRDSEQAEDRLIGHVVSCDGSIVVLYAVLENIHNSSQQFCSIGRLISIDVLGKRVVGMVFKVDLLDTNGNGNTQNCTRVQVELIGEISDTAEGDPIFCRGISFYPPLGSLAHKIRKQDLVAIYHPRKNGSVIVGSLSQDDSVAATVSVEDLLNRHFALVGTTGVGKSSALSLLLRLTHKVKPDLRVLVFDPHSEYSSAFYDCAVAINNQTLDLPFWLFQHEEFAEIVFRSHVRNEEENDALRDLVAAAKVDYAIKHIQGTCSARDQLNAKNRITADTPIPYIMSSLFNIIEDEIGHLESRYDRLKLRSLKNRLETLVNDPRYRFMFAAKAINDNLEKIIGQIFRFPHGNRPVTILQLAGIPTEVVNSITAVLCRIAFDLAFYGDNGCEVLVVCEEAHRYVPGDASRGFEPTRRAIGRIAKEGRKFGAFLGVVTQRPGELDPTILSQCSTVFAMRLANDRDQEIIRAAIADSSVGTISFLSSLSNREAIAFGEGTNTPMRLKFTDLPQQYIPRSSLVGRQQTKPGVSDRSPDLNLIVNRMRNMGGATDL